jgi:hypothetical protein
VPDWFPGTGWKQIAYKWRDELTEVTEKPYAFTKYQMSRGENEISFLSRLLEAGDSTAEEKHTNKWSAMSLYTAGADSVSHFCATSMFFYIINKLPRLYLSLQLGFSR